MADAAYPSAGDSWQHIGTGKTYTVVRVATDKTESREGNPVVIYVANSGAAINSARLNSRATYVRDLSEFQANFAYVPKGK